MPDLGAGPLHGLADRVLSSTEDCYEGDGQCLFDLEEERREVVWGSGQETFGEEHFA
jgi:hypothetical protein